MVAMATVLTHFPCFIDIKPYIDINMKQIVNESKQTHLIYTKACHISYLVSAFLHDHFQYLVAMVTVVN